MLSLIVAHDKNRVIGSNNQLPWHLPSDLAYFKHTTMNSMVVMGRKTYESIGKLLPGRSNVILTRQKDYRVDGAYVINNINSLLSCKEGVGNCFIIGGEEVFKQSLPFIDRLYITYIDHSFEGDTYFPEINFDEWKLISEEKGVKDKKNPYDYFYRVYSRARK